MRYIKNDYVKDLISNKGFENDMIRLLPFNSVCFSYTYDECLISRYRKLLKLGIKNSNIQWFIDTIDYLETHSRVYPFVDYSDYIADNLNKPILYGDYYAENLTVNSEYSNYHGVTIKNDSFFVINDIC